VTPTEHANRALAEVSAAGHADEVARLKAELAQALADREALENRLAECKKEHASDGLRWHIEIVRMRQMWNVTRPLIEEWLRSNGFVEENDGDWWRALAVVNAGAPVPSIIDRIAGLTGRTAGDIITEMLAPSTRLNT